MNFRHKRWQMAVVLSVSIIVALFDRLNINFAMPLIAADMGWKDSEIGEKGMWLAAVFYVSYGLANMFLTPFAERFGPRRSLLTIVVFWCLFTAMGAHLSHTLWLFIVARVLLGLAEGVHFPMMNLLSKQWFPLHERSRGNSVWAAGMFLSMILAPLILVPTMDTFGWRSTFIVMALLGLLVSFPLIYYFVFDNPDKHPRISAEEINYLRQHLTSTATEFNESKDESGQPSLADFLRSKAFLLLISISSIHYIIVYGIVTWLPTYFNKERGIEFGELSLPLMLPYLSSIIALPIWSYWGDKSNTRAFSAAFTYLLAAVCCFVAISTESVWTSLGFISAAIFFASAYNSAEWAFIQKVSPLAISARVGGIYNGISVLIGGVLGSIIVGSLASAMGSFSAGFAALGVLSVVVGGLLFMLGRLIRY